MKEIFTTILGSTKIRLIILLLFLSHHNLYSQVFVKHDATGMNDGNSWENAYNDLDFAIENTVSGDIWVSSGVYKPSTDLSGEVPSDDRLKTFRLKKDIAIYGGFIGTETELDQRDWINNETILTGDIGIEGDFTDNVRHVVSSEYVDLDINTKLDGLTISDGNAQYNGAGIYVNQTSGGQFVLMNCIIENNYSTGEGGGLYVFNCDPIIDNNIFRNNQSHRGGALYIYYSDALITNNEITNNHAEGGSTALSGGGIYVSSYSSPTIRKNVIDSNSSVYEGGGVTIESNYHTIFEANLVINNTSENGGGLFLDYSETYFINNIFTKNQATGSGGAIFMDYTPGGPEFINNVVTGNSAVQGGSGLYMTGSNANIVNSIVYYNSPSNFQIRALSNFGDWAPKFRYCDIQGGEDNIYSSGNQFLYENNLDVLPLFIDVNSNNFKLQSQSELINSGTMDSDMVSTPWTGSNGEIINFPTTDFEGNPRIIDIIDIGAYEHDSTLSINPSKTDRFLIYPNPTNGIIKYKFSNKKIKWISISDITGKVIFKKTELLQNGIIDLSVYKRGIYMINIYTDKEIFTTKIVKE